MKRIVLLRETAIALTRRTAMSLGIRDKSIGCAASSMSTAGAPEKDYQGKWYRECRDCGTVAGMSMFPPGAG